MRLIGETLNSLILACSVQGVPADIVAGIAITESNGYRYAISGSYQYSDFFLLPKTEGEAAYASAVADESIKRDINISIGLLQINSWHIAKMGASVDAIFEPCNNILMGTSIFKEILSRVCGTRFTGDCLDAGLRQYNTGSVIASEASQKYVERVRANIPAGTIPQLTVGFDSIAQDTK